MSWYISLLDGESRSGFSGTLIGLMGPEAPVANFVPTLAFLHNYFRFSASPKRSEFKLDTVTLSAPTRPYSTATWGSAFQKILAVEPEGAAIRRLSVRRFLYHGSTQERQ